MKTAQYVRQERAIAAADSGTIRQRWEYGLRILNDPEKMADSGKSLRHGAAQNLITAAAKAGTKLSEREIQWRIRCAKAYPKESQIRNAITDFRTWFDLIQAGFPHYDAPADEPLADYRTTTEKQHDASRRLLDLVGEQGTLFPLEQFEPTEATLKDLVDYTDEQRELTSRFVLRDQKRAEYLARLIEAAEGDLSMTWDAAAQLLPEPDDDPLAGNA